MTSAVDALVGLEASMGGTASPPSVGLGRKLRPEKSGEPQSKLKSSGVSLLGKDLDSGVGWAGIALAGVELGIPPELDLLRS